MSTSNANSLIVDSNCRYLGIELNRYIDIAGKLIAEKLISKYGREKSYAFLCGMGHNGADGMAAARHLANMKVNRVNVYLVGRPDKILSPVIAKEWQNLKGSELTNLTLHTESKAADVTNHEIIVEALVGTGLEGSLRKREREIISRATHFRQKMVAIDAPVPGYSWDICLSILYPKTDDAFVINVGLPAEVFMYTGPGEVKALNVPRRSSYKSQNGKLLIIGGSEKYHGAVLLAAAAASKYAGLVYLFPGVRRNEDLMSLMESNMAEFIEVSPSELEKTLQICDAALVGPGWEENLPNKALLDYILVNYPQLKVVLDAAAVKMADFNLIKEHGQVLLTPHRGEAMSFLGNKEIEALPGKLKRICQEYNCHINLKGSQSLLVGSNSELGQVDSRINRTGNSGMAKGGSGDVLAGITAAFATTNSLWLSMCAGAFISGLAGDLALTNYGHMFSASDSVNALQQAWKWCQDF